MRFQGVAGVVEAEPDEDLPGVAVLADFIERDRGRGDPFFLLALEQIRRTGRSPPCPASSPARSPSARQFLSAAGRAWPGRCPFPRPSCPAGEVPLFPPAGSSAARLPPLESRILRSAIRCLTAIGCSRGSQATSSETCKAGGDELRNSRLASTDTGSIRIGPWIAARPVRGRSFGPRGTICNARGLAIGIDRQLGLIQHRVQRGPERRLVEIDGDFRIGDRGAGRPRQVGNRVAGLFLDLGEHFGDFQPPVQRDGRGLDALGGLGLLQLPGGSAAGHLGDVRRLLENRAQAAGRARPARV